MCGIVLVRGEQSEVRVNKYLERISHRGTEPYLAHKVHQHLTIGFVRLPINDAGEKANQPFIHKNLIGAFNCEIYNHSCLTRQFKLERYLVSQCDAEVILPLWQTLLNQADTHGAYTKLLSCLDGFYSGIVYDTKSDTIFCIRDYIGKKPLFLIRKKDAIIISSELKAVGSFDSFEVIPKGISMIHEKNVKMLCSHELGANQGEHGNIDRLLYQAVKKRIPPKKHQPRFGVFLSGGLDSSIVAALVSQITANNEMLARPVFYYLSNDKECRLADYQYIQEIIDYLKITDCTKSVSFDSEEIRNNIPKIIYHSESYHPSIISNGIAYQLLAYQAKKDGIKVVLTGDGADEMFLGYFVKGKAEYKQFWFDTIDDLEKTELRRIDLISMANSIEVRCPFLDRKIYDYTAVLSFSDFYGLGEPVPKNHLKQVFKNKLPHSIVEREKRPLDVGSGIQRELIECSDSEQQSVLQEKEFFKEIWLDLFPSRNSFVDHVFFHRYRAFESFNQSRWDKYKK